MLLDNFCLRNRGSCHQRFGAWLRSGFQSTKLSATTKFDTLPDCVIQAGKRNPDSYRNHLTTEPPIFLEVLLAVQLYSLFILRFSLKKRKVCQYLKTDYSRKKDLSKRLFHFYFSHLIPLKKNSPPFLHCANTICRHLFC